MGDGKHIEFLRDIQAPGLSRAVEPESWFYWQAYHHLRGEGCDSMGPRPIPVTAIANYAMHVAGITCGIEKARLIRVIMAMDDTSRAVGEKKAKQNGTDP